MRKKVNRLWRKYAVLIAFVTLAVLGTAGYVSVGLILQALRDANVEACETANEAREADRTNYRTQIQQTKQLDATKLFPNTDPALLDALMKESIKVNRKAIKASAEVDCQQRYPDTGDIFNLF